MSDGTNHESSDNDKPKTDSAQLLFAADKLAQLLDISTRTLWRLRAAGKLPAPIRVGGSVRWRVQDIETWIAEGCPALNHRK